jgi:hypothetical protein
VAFEVDDLDGTLDLLRARGVRLIAETPDGERIELFQYG